MPTADKCRRSRAFGGCLIRRSTSFETAGASEGECKEAEKKIQPPLRASCLRALPLLKVPPSRKAGLHKAPQEGSL